MTFKINRINALFMVKIFPTFDEHTHIYEWFSLYRVYKDDNKNSWKQNVDNRQKAYVFIKSDFFLDNTWLTMWARI